MTWALHAGDCLLLLPTLAAESVDAVVTDPPYHLTTGKRGGTGVASVNPNSPAGRSMIGTGFMGKAWDGGDVAFRRETWAEVYRVLKPGGHMACFGGARTQHRMACAIEDAGFEIRDSLMWVFGSGFPKSLDVSKEIDKLAGLEREVLRERYTVKRIKPGATVEREGAWGKQDIPYTATDSAPATPEAALWQGWGTALKPAHEPIILARKPLIGTVVANVLTYGVGGINVDACRVEGRERTEYGLATATRSHGAVYGEPSASADFDATKGRWPANVLHDGSDEVLAAFAEYGESKSIQGKPRGADAGLGWGMTRTGAEYADTGTAARFFYCAKANATDRAGSKHPTVKPQALMRWLCRLITPPGGTILDPFAGTGSTLQAARDSGFSAIGIELEAEYFADMQRRMGAA